MVRVRVGFMVRVRVGVRVRIRVNLTLTKTLELNLNLLSYWECCRNMVRKKKFASQLAIILGSSSLKLSKKTFQMNYFSMKCLQANELWMRWSSC